MTIRQTTETVLVNGDEDLAIIIEVDADDQTSLKKLVAAVQKAFVLQKMISTPEIAIFVLRINGDLNRDEFVEDWHRQLRGKGTTPVTAKAFLDHVIKIVDAMHYPPHGDPVRFDLAG